jgi:hypothetical protein
LSGLLTPPDDVRAEHVRLTQSRSAMTPTGPMPEHRAPVVEELALQIQSAVASSATSLPAFSRQRGSERTARPLPFLTADPVAVVWSKGSRTECVDFYRTQGTRHAVDGDAIDAIRTLLAPHASEPVPGLPPFRRRAGYLATTGAAHSSAFQRRVTRTSHCRTCVRHA